MKQVSIDFHASVTVSASLKRQILVAAKKTLNAIPKRLFRIKTRHAKTLSLSVVVLGPVAMKRLNFTYRKKNKPTDVLSFSRMEGQQIPTIHQEIGEVILCLSVAKKAAKDSQISLSEEVQRLTIHGVLHLFGYDHETNQRDAKRMFALQESILAKLCRVSRRNVA